MLIFTALTSNACLAPVAKDGMAHGVMVINFCLGRCVGGVCNNRGSTLEVVTIIFVSAGSTWWVDSLGIDLLGINLYKLTAFTIALHLTAIFIIFILRLSKFRVRNVLDMNLLLLPVICSTLTSLKKNKRFSLGLTVVVSGSSLHAELHCAGLTWRPAS